MWYKVFSNYESQMLGIYYIFYLLKTKEYNISIIPVDLFGLSKIIVNWFIIYL